MKETRLAVGKVQRELKVLCEAGVITRSEEQGRVYFQADPRSVICGARRRLEATSI